MKKGISKFGSNIKFLRKRKKQSQQAVANALKISREVLNSYENNGTDNPCVRNIIKLSQYFNMDVDTLLKKKLTEEIVQKMETVNNGYATGSNMSVLSITVNQNNDENIHLVEEKARAGYISGFQDPDTLRDLPVFQIPTLPKDGSYRIFEITGRSMLPIADKSFVLGKYVNDFHEIKNGAFCIIVTDDGIVFKQVFYQINRNETIRLRSLNPSNDDYEIAAKSVRQLWKFAGYYSKQMPEVDPLMQDLVVAVQDIKEIINKWI